MHIVPMFVKLVSPKSFKFCDQNCLIFGRLFKVDFLISSVANRFDLGLNVSWYFDLVVKVDWTLGQEETQVFTNVSHSFFLRLWNSSSFINSSNNQALGQSFSYTHFDKIILELGQQWIEGRFFTFYNPFSHFSWYLREFHSILAYFSFLMLSLFERTKSMVANGTVVYPALTWMGNN